MDPNYRRRPLKRWLEITNRLLDEFPLERVELVELVLSSWGDIFSSSIGKESYNIGEHIFPQPQIMGFFLHELVPLNLARKYPGQWRVGAASNEFDAVYVPNDKYSFEIKTSSSASGIFGNRSYAHVSEGSKKRRGSYILAINFEKFDSSDPNVTLVRFGWLDADDWIGQRAESGQQSRLTKDARAYKLVKLWERSKSSSS
jgi:hypothetical protein